MSKMSKTIAILGVVAGLGVAALPLSTYAAESTTGGSVSEDTTVKLTIARKLSITVSKTDVDLGDGTDTGDVNVTVATNNTKGYDLKITASTEAPTEGGFPNGASAISLLNNNGIDFINAGVMPSDGSAVATSVWSYKVAAPTAAEGEDEAPASGTIAEGVNSWSAVSAGGTTIMSSTSATKAAGETAVVTFGAAIKDGQAAGTYTGKVTFTASDKE